MTYSACVVKERLLWQLILEVGILHRSDRLGFTIIIAGLALIGGTYLLFRLLGNSYLIAFLAFLGLIALMALIGKFFQDYHKEDE
jgi:hypothetical protein